MCEETSSRLVPSLSAYFFCRPVEARGRDAVLDRIFEVVHFGSFPFKMTYRVRSDMEKWKNVVKQAKIVFAAQSRLA
jgi:hypothetical protein